MINRDNISTPNILNYYLACFALTIVFISVIAAFYLIVVDQNPPITYNNLPFHTTKTEYVAGDAVDYTVDYCLYTKAVGVVTRYIISSEGMVAAQTGNNPVSGIFISLNACDRITETGVVIPNGTPPGRYRIEGMNVYNVNNLSTRIVRWRTQEFNVVEGGGRK